MTDNTCVNLHFQEWNVYTSLQQNGSSKGRFFSANHQTAQYDKPAQRSKDISPPPSKPYPFLERFLEDTEKVATENKQLKNKNLLNGKSKDKYGHSKPMISKSESCVNLNDNFTTKPNVDKKRAKSAIRSSSPLSRSQSLKRPDRPKTEHSQYQQGGVTANIYLSSERPNQPKYYPSLDYPLGVNTSSVSRRGLASSKSSRQFSRLRQESTDSSVFSPRSAVCERAKLKSLGSDSESSGDEQIVDSKTDLFGPEMLDSMTDQEKDEILAEVIQMGDRVKILVPQKPPKYGRKKCKQYTHM